MNQMMAQVIRMKTVVKTPDGKGMIAGWVREEGVITKVLVGSWPVQHTVYLEGRGVLCHPPVAAVAYPIELVEVEL
jgi:hypothetical protein